MRLSHLVEELENDSKGAFGIPTGIDRIPNIMLEHLSGKLSWKGHPSR